MIKGVSASPYKKILVGMRQYENIQVTGSGRPFWDVADGVLEEADAR